MRQLKFEPFIFSNGFQCPSTYNPADFIIGTLATVGHMCDPHELAHRICDAYAVSQIPETRKLQSISEESLDDVRSRCPRRAMKKKKKNNLLKHSIQQCFSKQSDFRKPLWILTILWLIHRNFLIVVRDPTVQTLRIIQKIV